MPTTPCKEGPLQATWHSQLALPLQQLPELLGSWATPCPWIHLRIWGKLVAHLRVPNAKVSVPRCKGAWDNVDAHWPRLTQALKGEEQLENDSQVATARSETLLDVEALLDVETLLDEETFLESRDMAGPTAAPQDWLTGERLRRTLLELCEIWGQQPQAQLPLVDVVDKPATTLQAQAFVQILGRLLDQWPPVAEEDRPLEVSLSLPPAAPADPPDQGPVAPGCRAGQMQHLAPAPPRPDQASEGEDQKPPALPQESTPEASGASQTQLRDSGLQSPSPSAHLPTQDSCSSCPVPPPSAENLETSPAQAAPRGAELQSLLQEVLMDATPRGVEGEQGSRLLRKRAHQPATSLEGAPPAKDRPQRQPGREGPASAVLQATPSAPLQGAAVPRHQPGPAQSSPPPANPAQPEPPAQRWLNSQFGENLVAPEEQGEPVNALGRPIFPQLEFENTNWEEPPPLDLDLTDYDRFVIEFQAGPDFPHTHSHLRAFVIQNIIKKGLGFPLDQLVAVILHETGTELDVCFKSDQALCQFWRQCRVLARSSPHLFEQLLPGVRQRGSATTVYITFRTTTVLLADVAEWLQRFVHILAGPEEACEPNGVWTGKFRARVRFKEGGRRALPKLCYLGHELGITKFKGQPPSCFHCGSYIRQRRIRRSASARCDLCDALGHSYPRCPQSVRFIQRQQRLQAARRARAANLLGPRARPAPEARDPQHQPAAQPPLDEAGPGPQP